jgi:hypothetical protein
MSEQHQFVWCEDDKQVVRSSYMEIASDSQSQKRILQGA